MLVIVCTVPADNSTGASSGPRLLLACFAGAAAVVCGACARVREQRQAHHAEVAVGVIEGRVGACECSASARAA